MKAKVLRPDLGSNNDTINNVFVGWGGEFEMEKTIINIDSVSAGKINRVS